mmetsp:Transcript_15158/g.51179  ORF Transcript_15158/g.51179 Transcript_15158/m.51179 type:complete len:281 (-) Transcript_15158:684-1526(-)
MNSSGRMSSPVYLAPLARGRSRQSLALCVIAPQLGQAPLRYEVAAAFFWPRTYHWSMPATASFCLELRWCLRPGAPWLRYQGALAMNSGMCGLISRPSSSTSAGSVPALRASSISRAFLWSTRDKNWPVDDAILAPTPAARSSGPSATRGGRSFLPWRWRPEDEALPATDVRAAYGRGTRHARHVHSCSAGPTTRRRRQAHDGRTTRSAEADGVYMDAAPCQARDRTRPTPWRRAGHRVPRPPRAHKGRSRVLPPTAGARPRAQRTMLCGPGGPPSPFSS